METNNLVFGEESRKETTEEPRKAKQFEYIKDQLKYLGFGESKGMHDSLERWILSDEKRLILNTSSERVQAGNEMNFSLNFSKSEKGGGIFEFIYREFNYKRWRIKGA